MDDPLVTDDAAPHRRLTVVPERGHRGIADRRAAGGDPGRGSRSPAWYCAAAWSPTSRTPRSRWPGSRRMLDAVGPVAGPTARALAVGAQRCGATLGRRPDRGGRPEPHGGIRWERCSWVSPARSTARSRWRSGSRWEIRVAAVTRLCRCGASRATVICAGNQPGGATFANRPSPS